MRGSERLSSTVGLLSDGSQVIGQENDPCSTLLGSLWRKLNQGRSHVVSYADYATSFMEDREDGSLVSLPKQ